MACKSSEAQFSLSFSQAIDALFEGYFIQGERFRDGAYIKFDSQGVANLYDAHSFSRFIAPFVVESRFFNQNFRRFSVAHQAIVEQD